MFDDGFVLDWCFESGFWRASSNFAKVVIGALYFFKCKVIIITFSWHLHEIAWMLATIPQGEVNLIIAHTCITKQHTYTYRCYSPYSQYLGPSFRPLQLTDASPFKDVRRCDGAALNRASFPVTRPFPLKSCCYLGWHPGGSHGQRLKKTVDFTSRGDDGMYHQSALERFLRVNVRRGFDGVGLQWLRWWQCWKGQIFCYFGMNPIVQHIFLQMGWNHFLVYKHAHFVLYRWSLCEKVKIFGPHGSDNLPLSSGCVFELENLNLFRLWKWWEFHVLFFCDVYIRDIHGEACIVGHVATLGCRTVEQTLANSFSWSSLSNGTMVGFFHKMTCTSFSTGGFWWIFVLRFANPFRIPNATPTSPLLLFLWEFHVFSWYNKGWFVNLRIW